MEDEEVGTYASFMARMGRASSELREIEGAVDRFMIEGEGRDRNIMNSSSDESYSDLDILDLDETTPDSSENADKTTLVIPPEEIQGFLRDTGLNSRPRRTGIKVKKEDGQFLCPICQHPFKGRNSAIRHTYTHMNELELQKGNIYHQRCPHSPTKIFFSRKQYADHINSHEGIKNHKCQICQKDFGGKGGLQYHMLTHANEGSEEVETPFPFRHLQCYFCSKRVMTMSHLIAHMRVHTQETPFKCSYCNNWFTQDSNMNSHMRKFHTYPDIHQLSQMSKKMERKRTIESPH